MAAIDIPIFKTCGCEVDFTIGTRSRRQPPLAHTRSTPGSGAVESAQSLPGRCERHQTEWLKAHEEGLLAYMNLRVSDVESKLAAAETHEGMYSKQEMLYKKRQLKAEKTIRGLAALGLWRTYPATWGLCAVTTVEGGETSLIKLEDMAGIDNDSENQLDEGWEDEDGEVEGGVKAPRMCEESGVDERGGWNHSKNAGSRASLGREGRSRAVDQKWYWWW